MNSFVSLLISQVKSHVELVSVRIGKQQLCMSAYLSVYPLSIALCGMLHCQEPIVNRPSVVAVSNLHFAPNW